MNGIQRIRLLGRSRLMAVAAAALALLVVALVFLGGGGRVQAAAMPGTRTPASPNALSLGRAGAPVTMIEYADFQCPFCGKFARDTQPQLVRRYVRTGKLRLVWHDFPYLDPQSRDAAIAARAAARQGRFWQFHNALYALKLRPFSGQLTRARLTAIARRIGLDVPRFERDLSDPTLGAAVDADFRQGQSLGITGTPTFFINGNPIVGAQPLPVFEQVIDAALARSR